MVTEKPCLKLLEKFREIVSGLLEVNKEPEVTSEDSAVNASEASEDTGKAAKEGENVALL